MCRGGGIEWRFRGIIGILYCLKQKKVEIIPLNPDSVLLFLHNSKLAYFKVKINSCIRIANKLRSKSQRLSLTETDIPGASLHGRKPAEIKKADLLFWLQCRGDSCKGMAVKAQLARRYVCVEFLMFYKKLYFKILCFFFHDKTNPYYF